MNTSGKAWVEGLRARSSVTTWVPLPPQEVFEYVSDFSRHHEWATNHITVTPVSEGPARLGSKYRSVGIQAGKEWPSELEISGYEPPRRFEFTATGGPLDAPDDDPHRHEFLMTPENGGTRLELRRTDPKPPSWPAWLFRLLGGPIVRGTMKKRIATVESLRTCLERQKA